MEWIPDASSFAPASRRAGLAVSCARLLMPFNVSSVSRKEPGPPQLQLQFLPLYPSGLSLALLQNRSFPGTVFRAWVSWAPLTDWPLLTSFYNESSDASMQSHPANPLFPRLGWDPGQKLECPGENYLKDKVEPARAETGNKRRKQVRRSDRKAFHARKQDRRRHSQGRKRRCARDRAALKLTAMMLHGKIQNIGRDLRQLRSRSVSCGRDLSERISS